MDPLPWRYKIANSHWPHKKYLGSIKSGMKHLQANMIIIMRDNIECRGVALTQSGQVYRYIYTAVSKESICTWLCNDIGTLSLYRLFARATLVFPLEWSIIYLTLRRLTVPPVARRRLDWNWREPASRLDCFHWNPLTVASISSGLHRLSYQAILILYIVMEMARMIGIIQ